MRNRLLKKAALTANGRRTQRVPRLHHTIGSADCKRSGIGLLACLGIFQQPARFSLLLALAGFCACRQEEARRDPTPVAMVPSAAAASADNRPVIACFGDSLTAGFGVDESQSYPAVLQRELDQRGYRYRVSNLGESGDTTQDGLTRLSTVTGEKPALVVLEFGANDGLRGQPLANVEANLARMIAAFQQTSSRVVLAGMTLPPNYGPEYIRQFEGLYKRLAAKYKLAAIPFLLAGVGGDPQLMQRDGLHPNVEGYRRVAGTVEKAIEPFLKKQ
jgi:acyl-CoA thioesterase I